MNQYLTLFLVSTFLISLSCSTSKQTKVVDPVFIDAPKQLSTQKIFCLNMAEKIAGIGSKNDEILLLVFHKDQNQKIQLLGSSGFQKFEKEDKEGLDLNLNFDLNELALPNELQFVLIEMDTERTVQEISELVQNEISKNHSSEILADKIRDDDLLGIQTRSLKRVQKEERLKFWGVHFFDEYHYEVAIKYE